MQSNSPRVNKTAYVEIQSPTITPLNVFHPSTQLVFVSQQLNCELALSETMA